MTRKADTSPSFQNGIEFAWSATAIKAAENCLRYYQYMMVEGWTSKSKSAHLIFGGHYAKALEQFHKKTFLGMDKEQATREVLHQAMIDTWTYAEDGTSLGPWESGHNFKTRDNLIRSIIWYLDQFKNDAALPVRLADGSPAVELSFSLPVDDGNILVGHLDRVVDFADNLYVQDQKTTGTTISSYFFEGFSPDTQMSLYSFAGSAIFKIPVKGVMIDAAQIAVGFTRFERGFTFRTDGQLNEWYDSAMYAIQAAQKATRENHFPMNPSACGNYGGCDFRSICSRAPGVRKNYLAADFILGGGYDPLEQR